MTLRMEVFVSVASLLLLTLLTTGVYFLRKARKSSQDSWDNLFSRLQIVNRENIARIAIDMNDGSLGAPNSADLEDSEIWELIGGLEGLLVLQANCDVLIDMAAYVQRWHPEAIVIAEELRVSARHLQWHVSRLQGAAATGNLESAFSSYAQRAVLTYYQMTQSLLGLYEWTNLPESTALKTAL